MYSTFLNIMRAHIHFSKHQVSPKKPLAVTPAEMAAVIHAAWKRGDISHADVQRELGIHQSQFSKLVNGQFKQAKGHAARLFAYSMNRTAKPSRAGSDVGAEALRSALMQRLMLAWDGTPEGAKALEAILEGAARLQVARLRKGRTGY